MASQHYKLTTADALIKKFSTDFSKIVAIYAGWMGFVPIGGLTPSLVEHLPASLKVITSTPVGYDAYDVPALKSRGIQLYNSPSMGAGDVADTAMWHILESFRYFKRFEKTAKERGHTLMAREDLQTKSFDIETGSLGVEKDDWLANAFAFGEIAGGHPVIRLAGKTCGIVGLGRIGQEIAKRASAFGMNVVYTQRNENKDMDYKYCKDVDELCSMSDCVVISCPGNANTRGLIGKKQIDLMKTTARLFNFGRGFIIDEDYAIKRLEEGKLGWIGLDVFANEPMIDKRLLNRWDVSLTPHIGSSSVETFDATAKFALANIYTVIVNGVDGQSRVC